MSLTAQGFRGEALSGLGGGRPGDKRAESLRAALVEDAPIFHHEINVGFSPHDWTTLWGAAALGYPRIVTTLLHRGTPLDLRDALGRTALHYATEFRQTETLCLLVERGADVNMPDSDGKTPVFCVREPDAARFLTILQNGGADMNRRDNQGGSSLLYALCAKQRTLATALQKRGAEPGLAEAVMLEAEDGLEKRHDTFPVNSRLPDGDTLLCRAARSGRFVLVFHLLQRGADPNLANADGERPLDAAAQESRGRLLRLLLDNGADPNRARTDPSLILSWAGQRHSE